MTIYEKTNTTISEILTMMIIKPDYIFINSKKYNISSLENLNHWREFFKRNDKIVKTMKYFDKVNVLTIETK